MEGGRDRGNRKKRREKERRTSLPSLCLIAIFNKINLISLFTINCWILKRASGRVRVRVGCTLAGHGNKTQDGRALKRRGRSGLVNHLIFFEEEIIYCCHGHE